MYGVALVSPRRWGSFRRAMGVYLTLTLALGAVTTPTTLLALDYYVSTSGSDANAGTSSGTAFRTLTKAIATAGSGDVIHVGAGTFDTSDPNEAFPLDIKDGVSIMGAGAGSTTVSAPAGGAVFFGNTNLASSTTLTGMTITHDSQSSDNVGISLTLSTVTMSPQITNDAFVGDPNDPGSAGDGIRMIQPDSGGGADVFTPTIDGNTFSGLHHGFWVADTSNNVSSLDGGSDTISPQITNNTFESNVRGIAMDWVPYYGGALNGTIAPFISGNTFTNQSDDAIDIEVWSGSSSLSVDDLTITPQITNNKMNHIVGGDGAQVNISDLWLNPSATLVVSPTMTGNSVTEHESYSQGFAFYLDYIDGDGGTITSNATITGNKVDGDTADSDAILVSMSEIYQPIDTKATIAGNTISNHDKYDAVAVVLSTLSTATNVDYTVENNILSNVGGDAFWVDLSEGIELTSSANASVVVRGNTVDTATDDGIDLSLGSFNFDGDGKGTFLVEGNSFSNVQDDGIDMSVWSLISITTPSNVGANVADNWVSGALDPNDPNTPHAALWYRGTNTEMQGTTVTCNTLTGSNLGAYVASSEVSSSAPDFGGGGLSPGLNSFAGNAEYALSNDANLDVVFAESNYWGVVDPTAVIGGNRYDVVDPNNPLGAAPTSGVTSTLAAVLNGQQIDYTAVVTGSGDCGSAGVTFSTPIPTGTVLVPNSVLTDTGYLIPDPNDPNTPITVQLGHLMTGQTATITFSVTVNNGITQVIAQDTISRNGGMTTLSDDPNAVGGGPTITNLASNAIPTLQWWAMMLMMLMLGGAALIMLRRRKHGVALVLALAMLLPGASLRAATTHAPSTAVKPMAKEVPAGSTRAVKPRPKVVATTLVTAGQKAVTRGPKMATLKLADGSSYTLREGAIRIRDRRRGHQRLREVRADALWNGTIPASQPMLVKVMFNADGSADRVRILLYDSLAAAQTTLVKRAGRHK